MKACSVSSQQERIRIIIGMFNLIFPAKTALTQGSSGKKHARERVKYRKCQAIVHSEPILDYERGQRTAVGLVDSCKIYE